ncbi:unnamed protein product [Arabidopsis halleri]
MTHSLFIDRILARIKKSPGRRGDKTSPVRRLDLRDASSINYDAGENSSSLLMTHSLDFPNHTSFRVGEGEIDRIYRYFDVSGPEGFAISSDAWKKAGKERSSSDVVNRLKSLDIDCHEVQSQGLSEAGPSVVVVASNLTLSESNKIENLSSLTDKEVVDGGMVENNGGIERKPSILVKSREYLVPNDAVVVGGGIKVIPPVLNLPQEDKEVVDGGTVENRSGIKGVRPSVLKPPPVMKLPPVDLPGSSWDFLTHFAPDSETVRRPSSSSSSENGCDEEEDGDEKVEKEETGDMFIQLDDMTDEACSITTNECDSTNTVSNTSPIYASGGSVITSWLKAQLRRSFGSVNGGISGLYHYHCSITSLSYFMSSSSSSVDSDSTCSLVTPSLEFPDRVSFRKMDFSNAGPSRRVWEKRILTRSKLTESFCNREDMVIVTSWLKGQLLGRGSYASVYEAISEDGDFFAVKEVSLLDLGIHAQDCIEQLEREITLLSQLQHQNIVRYRGTAKDGSKLYIFLELVTQGSLQKLYERYQLRDSVVSMYTRQILNGLKYLHDKGFVHRDIKCANILVDANGTVKLVDFGLAEVLKFNDIKSCWGTPFWMAPEIINRKDSDGYGSPADIWSLGCTVLEMCTGKIPYSDLEPVQALFRIGRGTLPEVPYTLSQDARHFILKCLTVSPEERPTAAELLNHPFVRSPLPPFM